jgi:beta-barrel assembly-enhancing protease
MRDKTFIREVLHRRDLLAMLGLGGTALVLQGCLTQGDLQSLVTEANFNKLFVGPKYSEKDEIQMGKSLYGPTIDQSGGAYNNPRLQKAMGDFARPLFATSSRPSLPWEITILEDNTVNAWALPGGKIAVNKGLLRYCPTDAELAAVIGHEMGHVERSHAVQEMSSESRWSSAADLGKNFAMSKMSTYTSRIPGTNDLTKEALDALQGPLLKLVTSGYSRENEFEADANILNTFQKSGHDPQKSYTFFETLLKLIPPDTQQTTSLYSKHPETEARIAALKEKSSTVQASDRKPADAEAFAQLKRAFPTRFTPVELPAATAASS